VAVATVWLLASGGTNVTATGGVAAGRDAVGNTINSGGDKP
jgi:hypothetical protein